MVPTYSSNVILAKARAMYGRRLTRANYRELLECRTVGEVASYLKNQTSYGSILAGINESDIHRGQLEIRLRQKLFEDNSALCRYEVTIGEHFANYLISRGEIEQGISPGGIYATPRARTHQQKKLQCTTTTSSPAMADGGAQLRGDGD